MIKHLNVFTFVVLQKNNKNFIMKRVSLLIISLFIAAFSFGQSKEKTTIEETINTCIADINKDSLKNYIQGLEDFGTRFALAENRLQVANWIKAQFERHGCQVELQEFEITVEWPWYSGQTSTTTQYNIVATMQGTTRSEEVYVIGGHYDSILNQGDPTTGAPGADDNASGVAAAIEIARVFKKNNYKPEATIKFIAFGAEELGLFGAKAYAKKAFDDNENIKLMLNNDMISYEPNASNWTLNFVYYNNSNDVTSLAKDMIDYTDLDYNLDNTYNKYSDSYAFYEMDFKCIFFAEHNFTPYYHTTNDLLSSCNMEYCAEATKLSCAMLVHEAKIGSTVVGTNDIAEKSLEINSYPNPCKESATLSYYLPKNSYVTAQIFNSNGKLISEVLNKKQEKGTHKLNLNTEEFNSGMYICVLKTDNEVISHRISVVK